MMRPLPKSAREKLCIYYDGTCRMCTALAKKVSLGSDGTFTCIDANVVLPPGVSQGEAMRDLHVVGKDGRMYKGAEGVLRILEEDPRWRWLARVGSMPGIKQVATLAYRLVADNRHRI